MPRAPKPLALTLDGALADFRFIRDIDSAARGRRTCAAAAGGIDSRRDYGTRHDGRAADLGRVRGARRRDPGDGSRAGLSHRDRRPVRRWRRRRGARAAAFEGATLTATARVPSAVFIERLPDAVRRWIPTASGPATLSAQVRSITSSVAAPFVDAGTLEQIALHSDASIDLEADRPDLDRVRGAVVLSRAELSLAGVAFDQQAPTRLAIARRTASPSSHGRGDATTTASCSAAAWRSAPIRRWISPPLPRSTCAC